MDILYRDADICIVNKPAGHVVHRTPGAEKYPYVLQELRDMVGQKVFPVHRLDRPTSGCLAFAMSGDRARELQRALGKSSAVKTYCALCLGETPEKGEYERPLSDENGIKRDAKTVFRLLQSFAEYSLVEVRILTGRHHQIRRHFSHQRHHIIGDVQHGKGWLNRRFREQYGFHRMFLHCLAISFEHPVTGGILQVKSELPRELSDLIDQLAASKKS